VRQTFKKLSKIKNSVYDVEAEKKYFHKNWIKREKPIHLFNIWFIWIGLFRNEDPRDTRETVFSGTLMSSVTGRHIIWSMVINQGELGKSACSDPFVCLYVFRQVQSSFG
jgi:hypothetical protein